MTCVRRGQIMLISGGQIMLVATIYQEWKVSNWQSAIERVQQQVLGKQMRELAEDFVEVRYLIL